MDVQLGETVDQQRIENLPLNGRNVYDLIGLMPGAVNVSTTTTGTNISNQMNVNGNRNSDNNFYIDGGQNTSQCRNGGNMAPNPDAIAEFHLITSNFDAEYGRQPGSVLNVVTRSGATRITARCSSFCATIRSMRGTFSRPPRLLCTGTSSAARSADRSATTRRFSLRRTRASGRRPARSRTAWWCRRSRSVRAISRRWRRPSGPPIPLTGKTFPGGIIPTSRFDPVAQAIIKTMVPLPNNAAGTHIGRSSRRRQRTTRECCASIINSPRPTVCRERFSWIAATPHCRLGPAVLRSFPTGTMPARSIRQNNVIINDDHGDFAQPDQPGALQLHAELLRDGRYVHQQLAGLGQQAGTRRRLPWEPPEFVLTSAFTAGPGRRSERHHAAEHVGGHASA